MTTSDLLLQVVLPVLTFVAGLYLQRFVRPRRAEILVIPTKSATLKSDFIDDFDGLRITLDDEPIDTRLGWISGIITVRGANQIERNQFRKPLEISLPSGWEWKRFHIEDHVSKAKSAIVDGDRRRCTIDWESLHEKEVLRFSALVDAPSPEDLTDRLRRATALVEVKGRVSDARVLVSSINDRKEVFTLSEILLPATMTIWSSVVAISMFFLAAQPDVRFTPNGAIPPTLSASESYSMEVRDGRVCLRATPEGECKHLSFEQVTNTRWDASLHPRGLPSEMRAMLAALLVTLALMLILTGAQKYRDYRNHRLLNDRVVWFAITRGRGRSSRQRRNRST